MKGTLMKQSLLALSLLSSTGAVQAGGVDVGGVVYELKFADFKPITTPFAERTAVIAYEAELSVDGDTNQPLWYDVEGEVTTKWFAGNLDVNLTVTCRPHASGVPPLLLGLDSDSGVRFEHHSYRARPGISTQTNAGGNCNVLKIRLDKTGNLSKMFYTVVTDLTFRVSVTEQF